MRAYSTHIAQRISATIARQMNPASVEGAPEGLAESLSRMLGESRGLSCASGRAQKLQQ
jgi:hypothetical protein